MLKRLVFMLFIPLIGFLLILTSIQSITDHGIDTRQDNLADQLSNFQDTVVIDGETAEGAYAGSDIAEQQFRGLVVWNMLAAQQCWYPTMFYQQDNLDEELQDEDIEDLVMERVENQMDRKGASNIQDLEENQFTYSYRGNPDVDVLRTVIDDTNLQGSCMGVDPVNIPTDWRDLMPSMDWGTAGIENWEGHSLQGKFGRTEFEIEESFVIEDHRMMAVNIGSIASSNVVGDDAPDFIRGDRAAVFYPENVRADKNDLRCSSASCIPGNSERLSVMLHHLGESCGGSYIGECDTLEGTSQHILPYATTMDDHIDSPRIDGYSSEEYMSMSLNAFRVQMNDVPHIGSRSFDIQDFENSPDDEDWGTGRSFFRGQHRWLTGRTHYLMCEGFEGYVRSKAGTMDAEGKEYAGEPAIYRDLVYPEVVITNADEVDIDECMEEVGAGGIDYMQPLLPYAQYGWIDTEIIIPQNHDYY